MIGNKNNHLLRFSQEKPTTSVILGNPRSQRNGPAHFTWETGRLSGSPGT